MNRTDVVKSVANRTGVSMAVVEQVLRGFIDVTKLSLTAEEEVSLRGFGRFVLRTKKAREQVNPATGERMQVPEVKVVVFLPSKIFKRKLNGRDE